MNLILRKIALVGMLALHGVTVYGLSEGARAQGFVYLHEVDPTIQVSVRYATDQNFVGMPVEGYQQPVIIMTLPAAVALSRVQDQLRNDGYCLVVYDAYRPQTAVNHFMRWAADTEYQKGKDLYYPYVNKADVFDLGYVAKRSGHSRGSTIDLSIIPLGTVVQEIVCENRVLHDGRTVKFLDDGTLDMGSSFDLFDEASHTASTLISEEAQARRQYLVGVMHAHGFKNYTEEWWHFTLCDEPFTHEHDESYFDFVVA